MVQDIYLSSLYLIWNVSIILIMDLTSCKPWTALPSFNLLKLNVIFLRNRSISDSTLFRSAIRTWKNRSQSPWRDRNDKSIKIKESPIKFHQRNLTSWAGFSIFRKMVENMLERIPLQRITKNRRKIGRSLNKLKGHMPHNPLGFSSSSSGLLSTFSMWSSLSWLASESLFFLFLEMSFLVFLPKNTSFMDVL